MEHFRRFRISYVLLFIFFSGCVTQTSGQEKVSISAGIGIPELLNVGVQYQLNQVQLGLSIGSMPIKDESLFSISGDVFA